MEVEDSIEEVASPLTYPEGIRELAAKYIWWMTPDESLAFPRRVIAQVMNLGAFSDYETVEIYFGREEMKTVLQSAQPGWFRDRSWNYWHYRLGVVNWGDDVPPLPTRNFDV